MKKDNMKFRLSKFSKNMKSIFSKKFRMKVAYKLMKFAREIYPEGPHIVSEWEADVLWERLQKMDFSEQEVKEE